MTTPSIVSPDDQKVTFVELFFDLVFVFSVTQIVELLHHGITLGAAGQAVLAFWLVWWAWTQFTWALNAADTTHPSVALGTLVATAVAFFMAVAVPDAFHGRAVAFAVPYVLVRAIGLGLYAWVAAAADRSQFAAVCSFTTISGAGLAAVIAGAFLGGTLQYWFWGLAILLDVIAALIAGRLEGWNVHPEHFAERHGLFVIIALGETLIVAAAGMTGLAWTADLVGVAITGIGLTCLLWWSYFMKAKPTLDHVLETSGELSRTPLARDVFSLLHFPMMCGVIAYAAAIGEAIGHPHEPLSSPARAAFAAGLFLFVGGMGIAQWRALRRLPVPRLAIAAAGALTVGAMGTLAPTYSFGLAFAIFLVLVVWEHRAAPPLSDAERHETVRTEST